jgi:hypothetical protein
MWRLTEYQKHNLDRSSDATGVRLPKSHHKRIERWTLYLLSSLVINVSIQSKLVHLETAQISKPVLLYHYLYDIEDHLSASRPPAGGNEDIRSSPNN